MDSRYPVAGFDRVIDALGHRYRRRLLVGFLDSNSGDDDSPDTDDVIGAVADADADETLVETELVHNHLPKLDDLGYIRWDREEGTISKGPNWDDIEPLLELLVAHEDELPDDWL